MLDQKDQTVNSHAVAQAVRKHLQPQLSTGITLEVIEPGIRQEEHWWNVPVRPSEEPTKRYEYYEVLADAEIDLDEKEHLKVFLIPTGPGPND